MAAPTVSIQRDHSLEAGFHLYEVEIDLAAYETGGVAIDVSTNKAFSRIVGLNGAGYVGFFDPATQLLKVYRQKDPGNAGGADIALVEVANAVDLTGIKLYGLATGA